MKILCLGWRDIQSQGKGGAEVFTHEMLKRNTKKHDIIHLSQQQNGLKENEMLDGVRYVRRGNMISMAWYGYKLQKGEDFDLILDQANTHMSFAPLWAKKNTPVVFFIHQLTREIWFQHFSGLLLPFGVLGYLLEPLFIRLYRDTLSLTVSESTKKGLIGFGHKENNIRILPEGLNFVAWDEKELREKEKVFTICFVGRFSKYKGLHDTIKAIKILKSQKIKATLWIMGKGSAKERENIKNHIQKEGLEEEVNLLGFVSKEEKLERMSRSHALVLPSGHEGWGLVVTEAAAVGTTSIGYPSPGLTDSIQNGKTGIITDEKSPESLAHSLHLLSQSPFLNQKLAKNAHIWAKTFHWDNTGAAFGDFLDDFEKTNITAKNPAIPRPNE